MRRNNCWLAVLAVTAVLSILQNGSAVERLSADYENAELQANRSKAAYDARGSNHPTPSIRTNDETDPTSGPEISKLSLEASRTSRFPRTREQLNSPAKEALVPGGLSNPVDRNPYQRSTKFADARLGDEHQVSPRDLISDSIHANSLGLSAAGSKLQDGLSEEDSPERSNKFQTAEPFFEATRRSFAEIPRAIREQTATGVSGERRLSAWISRGAIKDPERANDVIRRVSSDRLTDLTRTPEDETAEANRWRSSGNDVDSRRSHYSHVGRSSRGDDSLMTSRSEARKALGHMENRPVEVGRSTDAADASSKINVGEDIGFRMSSGNAREQTVRERPSRIDMSGNISTTNGTVERYARGSGSLMFDKKPPGTGDFLGFEERLRDARLDKLLQSFPNRRRRLKRYIRSSGEREEREISMSSSDEAKHLAHPQKSISSFTSKLPNREDDGKESKREDSFSNLAASRKSEIAEFRKEAQDPRDISSERRSTVNSDVQGDNGGVSSIQGEIRAGFSASSGTISIHSVPDSREHPASGRDRGNFFASRNALSSDTPSERLHSAEGEEILSGGLVHLHAASYNATNETAYEDDSNFADFPVTKSITMEENATAIVEDVQNDGKVSKTEASKENRETKEKDSIDRLNQSNAEQRHRGDKKDATKIDGSISNNATDNPEDVYVDSSRSSLAAKRNPIYSRSEMNSPTEDSFMAERKDSIVSQFGGRSVQDRFKDPGVRSVSNETREKVEEARNSIAGAQLDQSSANEEAGSRVSSISFGRESEADEISEPSKGEAEGVNDPSNSLVDQNDHGAEIYDESESWNLNGTLTNGSVIVFKDEEPRSHDLLNQNSRPSADEFADNEAGRFTFVPAQPKDVHGRSDNGTWGRINQEGRGKKNIEDRPTSTSAGTSPANERARSRKERKSRSSRNSAHNSTAKSVNLDLGATSAPKWINEEGRHEGAAGSTSPNIDSAPRTPETKIAAGSSALDRSTEFKGRLEDRSSVTSELDEGRKGSGITSSVDDIVALWPTSSSQPDRDASILVSSVNNDQRPGVDVTVSSLENEPYSVASVEDASPRNMDNSSHDLEPKVQWPVKHSAVVEGDLVLGGLMMVHEREDGITCGPVMPQGGVQALEAMLYTLDRLNDREIVPGVKIGAHILDDCDKDTYGLEMAVDFIKGSISNIDGAEYHCNKTAVRKVISGVVGAASSVTSIQVANLLRLFRIPQVSFFSTSPELSNKQRFEYFSRTIPSDHYQVKAMVDIVLTMGWSYVSIIYEESNYGIKAFEELEELLGKYDICIAIKEKLVKDSGVAEETAYDNIVLKLLTKPRAKGCIIFGSDQEVAGVMRAVRRCNATGAFSWIGSDGWSARGLVSNGNEPEVEGTLSVQPQANPVKGFEEYFLNLTVENNRRNPWFVEFWEDHFQCRYPNASETPYNKKYTKPCTTKERLTKQNTAFEDQLQFVSDAVIAFAYAFRDMHRDLCHGKPGLCDDMKPTNGTKLLKYLQEVNFEGLSGDKFKFDKNGDGPARYNIIHFKQTEPGKYKWVRVGKYLEGELRLNRSEIQFKLGHPQPPESVCSLPCEVGQAKKYVEGERCCWHCFNCTQYQIRHPKDETQCIPCRQGTVPDETHSTCRDIPEEFLRPESGWAIGAMSFSATGILITFCVCGVFLKHNDTPVVRASGRELSYVLLSGILLCYLVTFALVLRPTDIVCGIQRFAAGFCFTVVYAALLTKTNRISRIFNASKHSAKRPSFISPRSQLIICFGLVFVQILINGVWMIIDPARAMHHYPTREDNLLVCNSYVDASYMIAFAYPIMLIVVCTVYAVLTRKIPEAFNESKHIGFTMYTTCVIWLAFVPLYFGTGNNVELRITSMSVTISLSASVTIACLFSPKLYIILIRPERNVRQSMMPARYSTTKSSAVTATNASSMIAPITLTAATCDQNKAVKKHIITTIDCSTQSEYFEMEVKDQKNGKPPPTVVSRSAQTSSNSDKELNTMVMNKDSKENTTSTKQLNNNARIGNGPVNQADVSL